MNLHIGVINLDINKNTKTKKDNKNQKEEVEIIFNIRKPPSELGIHQLNQAWYKILKEMEKDGRLD